MKYRNLVESILAQFAEPGGNKVVPFITGKPGGGKSSCAREIARALAEVHGIPAERIIEFNPSLRESCDILGLPQMDGDHTRWLPPEEFWAIREGQGPCVLIIEELSDADMQMQNPLCRVILDRAAGQLKLSDELFIIATGNRTEDRSGATRLSTKLANRMRILSFEEDLDDWCEWASSHDINPVLTAFIRFRPSLLSDFDPSRSVNPTPRAWEDVSRIPMSLPPAVYFEHAKGSVGEGAAVEWTGFLKIFEDLPDFDEIKRNPDTCELPTKPDVTYAVVAKIMQVATKATFPKFYKFVKRLPPDYLVMMMRDMSHNKQRCGWLSRTPEWKDFCSSTAKLMVG